jgi:hypothetical protein
MLIDLGVAEVEEVVITKPASRCAGLTAQEHWQCDPPGRRNQGNLSLLAQEIRKFNDSMG